MLSIQHTILLWMMIFTGQIPVSYDSKKQQFYKTRILEIYSICYGVLTVLVSLVASYIFIQNGMKNYVDLSIYFIYSLTIVNIGSIAIVYDRLLNRNNDCEIYNAISQFHFKKYIKFLSFGQKDIDGMNSNVGIIILVIFFEILPYLTSFLNFIVVSIKINNDFTFDSATIAYIIFWICSLSFPMLMAFEVLKNNISLCNKIFKNVIKQSKRKMTYSQVMIIKHDIDQLIKFHYHVIKLIESVTKYFSLNYLITMLLILFNFVYYSYYFIQLIYKSEKNDNSEYDWGEIFPFFIFIIFYFICILICLKSPNQLITENNKLISTLQQIDCSYFDEQLNLSVCFK